MNGKPRDTYFVTGRGTRYEVHWRRCGVCGSTQARTRMGGYGKCMFRAIHARIEAGPKPIDSPVT